MTRQNPYTIIGTHSEYEVNSAHDLMVKANLDWEVTLENVFINETDPIEVPDRYATVKWIDGRIEPLAVVGSRYKTVRSFHALTTSLTIAMHVTVQQVNSKVAT